MNRISKSGTDCKTWIFAAVFIVLILCSSFLLFDKLDVHYMHYYDEHFYGLNAYEMIQSNDYVVHTYMGAVNDNNTKPPFGLWLIALSYKLFGFSLFSMRAQSALMMLLSQIILGLWARKRFGNIAGLTAMAMLIGTQAVYGFHFARFGDLDALYQLFFMIAMLCMIDSKRDFRRLYLSAAFCGFAYLTKSWHAFAIAVTCAVYLLITGRIRELTVKRILLLFASFLAVVLPWAIVRVARDGFTLFEQSIGIQVAGTIKITNDPSVPNRNVFGYLLYLLKQVHFDGALLIGGFSALALLNKRCRGPADALKPLDKSAVLGCAAWIFVTPVLLSFTAKKAGLVCVFLSVRRRASDGNHGAGAIPKPNEALDAHRGSRRGRRAVPFWHDRQFSGY
jgi:4-amino-4-deoxy-L-arabinose transferase-like glycosyltransferase